MIQQRTLLRVMDNSGAKRVRCIDVLGGFKKKVAYLGDVLVVSVVELRNKSKKTSKVVKGGVYRALLVRTKNAKRVKSGFSISSNFNSVVLINRQGQPIGTRILGSLPKVLKKKKFTKFISISTGSY